MEGEIGGACGPAYDYGAVGGVCGIGAGDFEWESGFGGAESEESDA